MLAALDPAPEATTDDYEAAAAIYRRCRGSGRAVGSVVDCVVAQCCVRHGYALLTKDRDFRRIAAHTALRVIGVQLRASVAPVARGMMRSYPM